MTEKCKAKRWAGFTYLGCENNAKKDGYCGVHHPDAVKRRREKSDARYDFQQKARKLENETRAFDRRAGARCRELGIKPEEIK